MSTTNEDVPGWMSQDIKNIKRIREGKKPNSQQIHKKPRLRLKERTNRKRW